MSLRIKMLTCVIGIFLIMIGLAQISPILGFPFAAFSPVIVRMVLYTHNCPECGATYMDDQYDFSSDKCSKCSKKTDNKPH